MTYTQIRNPNCVNCGRRPICTVFTRVVFGFHSLHPSGLFHGDVVDITAEAWDGIFENIAGCCKKFTNTKASGDVVSCLKCDNEMLCHYWIKIREQASGAMDKAVPYGNIKVFVSDSGELLAKYCKEGRKREVK